MVQKQKWYSLLFFFLSCSFYFSCLSRSSQSYSMKWKSLALTIWVNPKLLFEGMLCFAHNPWTWLYLEGWWSPFRMKTDSSLFPEALWILHPSYCYKVGFMNLKPRKQIIGSSVTSEAQSRISLTLLPYTDI